MRRWSRIACALLFAAISSGCAVPYYLQAIGGQIDLMRKREPIADIVADPSRDADFRRALGTVAELRRFAVTDLHLPDNDSYTSYADLGRSYVVWNVVATEPFSVKPQRWCFPFAGCVSYRGYFDRDTAERFQQRLDERGLDTFSGGSSAYSTLGYFSDPVLNTMLAGSVDNVAGILFHELAHQKVYIQDDSELSEGFATAIEEHGVEMWLRAHGDAAALERYLRRIGRRAQFAELVARQQSRLRSIFAVDTDDASKLAAKAAAFEQMRLDYAVLKEHWGGATDYDGWFAGTLNNATLVAITTYRRWLPGLKWRLREVGLTQFYADVAALAELPRDERVIRLERWDAQSSASGRLPQP